MISMAMFMAEPLMTAPAMKVAPPPNMEFLLPNALVTEEAKKDAISAAK